MAKADLKSRTFGLLSKTVEKVLSDEQRAAKVAKAVGSVQKGKDAFDKAQENFMRALGMPSKRDYKDMGKRISALKRRVRHLAERVEKKSPP
jgi:hypothetical protein